MSNSAITFIKVFMPIPKYAQCQSLGQRVKSLCNGPYRKMRCGKVSEVPGASDGSKSDADVRLVNVSHIGKTTHGGLMSIYFDDERQERGRATCFFSLR